MDKGGKERRERKTSERKEQSPEKRAEKKRV